MGEGLDIPTEFHELPIRILGPSTRRLLSIHLDPPAVIPSSHGVLGDLSGLAELAGFEFCHIRYFETKHSRTYACLEEWSSRQTGTIGNLLSSLIKMERFDCLSEIKEPLMRDARSHIDRKSSDLNGKMFNCELKSIEQPPLDLNITNNFPDNEEESGFASLELNDFQNNLDTIEENDEDNLKQDERNNNIRNGSEKNVQRTPKAILKPEVTDFYDDEFLTIDDKDGELKTYHACICCSDEDIELAGQLMSVYKEQEVDFFLPQQALLSGGYEFEALAEVIETRCNSRVIVILSKHYLTSSACVFATQFVKTLDPDAKRRKIIPVLLDEDLNYPRVLRGISSIKARRLKFGSAFWDLLSVSLHLQKVQIDKNMEMNIRNMEQMYGFNDLNDKQVIRPERRRKDAHSCLPEYTKPPPVQLKDGQNSVENNEYSSLNSIESSSSGFQSCETITESCSLSEVAGAHKPEPVYSSPGNSAPKRKNPGLKTLRRFMKSLNIMDRKPKLQHTKRSHSTSETLLNAEVVQVESRSHSTNVPPCQVGLTSVSLSSPVFNIPHAESEETLSHYAGHLSGAESENNLSRCNQENCKTLKRDQSIESVGHNILSPNIEPTLSKDTSLERNNLDITSRQISRDDNMAYNRCSSFDNASLLSEITSSDNNSVVSYSRKTSIDTCSNTSSFHQMPFTSSSRQASFECGSRQTSFEYNSRQSSFENNSRPVSCDDNSLTSVDDNMDIDKQQINGKMSESTDRQKSTVMFEIML